MRTLGEVEQSFTHKQLHLVRVLVGCSQSRRINYVDYTAFELSNSMTKNIEGLPRVLIIYSVGAIIGGSSELPMCLTDGCLATFLTVGEDQYAHT